MAHDEPGPAVDPNEIITIPSNDAFSFLAYKHGKLHFEKMALEEIARKVGTPFYAYSQAAIEANYDRCAAAFAPLGVGIYYAVKANHNQSVLRILANKGAGADIVSIGEAHRAIAAGIPASRIIFSGAGKTEAELAQALDLGIYQINVESANELEILSRVAVAKGKKAPVTIRINPHVEAKTLAKITTGMKGNKFGIDITDAEPVFERAASLPGIDLLGLSVHIGSQITTAEPFKLAYAKCVDYIKSLRAKGLSLKRLDLGGGFGVWYRNEQVEDFADWAAVIDEATRGMGLEVNIAPGRSLIAHAGIMVSRVSYIKQGSDRRFLVLDAAMNDLPRPSLYNAYHHIIPVTEPAANAPQDSYDVVGPICESTDVFAVSRRMPAQKDGDLIAFLSAGAYCAAMSYTTYNSRPLTPEVLVNGDCFAVVRLRPTIQELIDAEPQAEWLDDEKPGTLRAAP